jgi:hypothetical protein
MRPAVRAPIEAILSRLLEDHRHPVMDFAYLGVRLGDDRCTGPANTTWRHCFTRALAPRAVGLDTNFRAP